MANRRRTPSSRRRAAEQARRIGSEVLLARTQHGMTREDLARRAGVSWSTASRVEDGDPGVSLLTVCAVAEAAGVDVVANSYPGRAPSLRDTGQLTLAQQIRLQAHPSLRAALEMPAGDHGEAADLVFLGADEIVDTEIERMVVDFQAQHRRAQRKREYLASHHARPVRLVIAVEDTRRNRRALEPHMELIRGVLPAGSREILRCLRDGTPLGRDGLLWIRRRSARSQATRPSR